MICVSSDFWKGKRVFITGHTGFKGVWLSLWLQSMGAEVIGYSSGGRTTPEKNLIVAMQSFRGDICDAGALDEALRQTAPDVVFHMAGQSIVRRAFDDPIGALRTNVLGTVTLLESVRRCATVRAVVVVTTDKCYENRNWDWSYREADRLGGNDPYSASKACMELVTGAFRDSFFTGDRQEHAVGVATARAGNVIGGGDWSGDRLIPDLMRSFASGQLMTLRNPHAMRPWQYVLDTLRGYLLLAARLYQDGRRYAGSWNFGSPASDIRQVEWIVTRVAALWGADAQWELCTGDFWQEAPMMKLDSSKAAEQLQWKPVLELSTALEMTVGWYRDFYAGGDPKQKCLDQIAEYSVRTDRCGITADSLRE